MAGETWRAHRSVDDGATRRRRRRRRVARRAWTSATRWLSGELWGRVRGLAWSEARDTGGGVTHSPVQRCRRRRRQLECDGVGFGPGERAASDSSGRVVARSGHGARGEASSGSGAIGSSGVCSDSGCPNGAVGAAFKPPGMFGHRRPQQPIRARRGATLPLTGGPHTSVDF
jgi:hypothetical protein